MKCLLIINTQSGHRRSAPDEGALLNILRKEYDCVQTVHILQGVECNLQEPLADADAACVCGGDGTLSGVLNALSGRNIPIYFVPCGTVNDAARSAKATVQKGACSADLIPMSFGGRLFSYVAATGTFTPIGWLPQNKTKQKFGRLSYLFYAVKEYKVHKIDAQIAVNGKTMKGEYTLIMALHSKYVFGLPVNRMYKSAEDSPKILLIKAPKGIFADIELFVLFFRCFCVGFRAAHHGKSIYFDDFDEVKITLDKPRYFCIDGEKSPLISKVEVRSAGIKLRCMRLGADSKKRRD